MSLLRLKLPVPRTVMVHAVPDPIPVREPDPEQGDQVPDDNEDFAVEET